MIEDINDLGNDTEIFEHDYDRCIPEEHETEDDYDDDDDDVLKQEQQQLLMGSRKSRNFFKYEMFY